MFILSVTKDCIEAKCDYVTLYIKSVDHWNSFVDELGTIGCMCSSSLDFPEEYTDNKEIIELCDLIRS